MKGRLDARFFSYIFRNVILLNFFPGVVFARVTCVFAVRVLSARLFGSD